MTRPPTAPPLHAAPALQAAPPLEAPDALERSRLLLEQWRADLELSAREAAALGAELVALDRQLERLGQGRARVAVFGRVGVGKSSLLNALLGEEHFATDVGHGCTRRQQQAPWPRSIPGLAGVDLVDTPGIDEVAARARHRLAARVARGADLVLVVLDGDLSAPEQGAIAQLLAAGKPLLLVLNRIDCWPAEELEALRQSVRRKLPAQARRLPLLGVAAAPRRPQLLADGRVRSQPAAAEIAPLEEALGRLLGESGRLLLALNALRAADRFNQSLGRWRLSRRQREAQGLIGRFATLKATGVAANPLVLVDLAGGLACDTALVLQLSRLYGLPITPAAARQLLQRLAGQNALLGGVQLGLQLLLSSLRQLLLLAAPVSGGLSLAPAAPVALAQAALAVHTTRLTGRLTAAELLRACQLGPARPGALLERLARQDPRLRQWLEQEQPRPAAEGSRWLP